MKSKKDTPYFAAGLTAFCVITAVVLLIFALLRIEQIGRFFSTLSYILRPITFGLVLAFLLLPLHRKIFAYLSGMGKGRLCASKRGESLTNFFAILLSLLVLFVLIYLLLAMVIPQVYLSIVGLIQSMPG